MLCTFNIQASRGHHNREKIRLRQRDLAERLAEQEERQRRAKKAPEPPAAFLQKRQHIFADDAAKRADVNSSFGVGEGPMRRMTGLGGRDEGFDRDVTVLSMAPKGILGRWGVI